MRIVLVTTEYVTEDANYDGGLANYTYRAAKSLKMRGHEPVVVVASNRKETLIYEGIEVHRVPVIWYTPILHYFFWFAGMDWIIVSRALNREIKAIHRKQPVDIIQYTSLGATALFRISDIPAVARLSSCQKSCDDAYGVTHTFGIRVHQCMERAALRRVDAVFGPSRIVGRAVAQDAGVEVEMIETPFHMDFRNMDETVYREIALELKGREYLLFFGSLGLLKGIKAIGDMIYRLFERYPDLCFVFVGKDMGLKGGSAIKYVRKQAGKYSDRIIYRSRLRHQRLYPIIEHARLVVLPSRFDNFPNTCVEAMAFKKIVVGTKGTSFEELITDGVNGFLCERDNPDSLFEAIGSAMQLTPAGRAGMEERAHQRACGLSPEMVADKLIALYTRVIENPKYQLKRKDMTA